MNEIRRIKWVDHVKVIACILVVLGHFFQSMTKSFVLPETGFHKWFDTTIYYFHVPLFFICSGYLYQSFSRVYDLRSWKSNVTKKFLTLGIPYFTFLSVTWLLKTLFSSSVNEQVGSLWYVMFYQPIPPYWYLYCLFFIFVITPTFKDKKMAVIGCVIAFAFKTSVLMMVDRKLHITLPVLQTVLQNEIWFVGGMCIARFDVKVAGKKWTGCILGSLFLFLSIFAFQNTNGWISFGLGVLACVAVIFLVDGLKESQLSTLLSGYTMPIYLMHTLFAAPVRVLLLRAGIDDITLHIVIGIGISFIGPIIAMKIMERSKWLGFLVYPRKFLKTVF